MDKIALFGATGNVGRRIAAQLLEKQIASKHSLHLFASPASKGKAFSIAQEEFILQSPEECTFSDYTCCLFATDSDVSRHLVPKALAAGALVVDSSSAHRMQENVPLIVAPVNGDLIDPEKKRLYACPNCIASPLSLILAPLKKRYGIERAAVTTFQSTSGAGKDPMDELRMETECLLQGDSMKRRFFSRQIAFNVIPQIDKLQPDGFTGEEQKVIREVQKIVGAPFAVTATCVRVPVLIGHSISAQVELKSEFDLEEIRTLLSTSPFVKWSDNGFHTPAEVVGSDEVHIGRVRRDPTLKNGLQFWLCSDNLRRGAATDAVEACALLMQRKGCHAETP